MLLSLRLAFKASKLPILVSVISLTYGRERFEHNIIAHLSDCSDSGYFQIQEVRASQ